MPSFRSSPAGESSMSEMRDAIGVLLAGGQGERLWPLTRDRAKPAVPFGALYRIIDITLSNCINSDLRRVFVLTQYKALSLNRHIRAGLVAARRAGRIHRSAAAADARFEAVVSGHRRRRVPEHLFDRQRALEIRFHFVRRPHLQDGLQPDAASSMWIPAPKSRWRQFEIPIEAGGEAVRRDRSRQGLADRGFEEKPAHPKESPHQAGHCNASMGIYIFNTQLMIPILLADSEDPKSQHDFGKDILPRIISKHRVFAYNFVDENQKDALYWRDVGTLDAYYEANMDLVSVSPVFNLYDKTWPIAHLAASVSAGEICFCRSRAHGRGARFDRGRRLDHFGRPRDGSDPRLRRARQQLLRSGGFDHLQSRERRPPFADSPGHHRPARQRCRSAPKSATTWKPTSGASMSPNPELWWSCAKNR